MTLHQELIIAVLLTLSLTLMVLWILRLKSRIRTLQRFRRDFMSNLSHEFRTPLAVIKGYAETMTTRERPLEDKTSLSFLHRIIEYSDRMIQMVEELLSLSHLEEVGSQRTSSLIHLPTFLQKLFDRHGEKFQAKQLKWIPELKAPLENIEVDPMLLDLILNNLIDNAVKYSTRAGGVIRLSVGRKANALHFTLQDEGIGFLPEEMRRSFERFYRGQRARQLIPEGSGLGLAICKHAVQSLGGKIWIQSQSGKGSEISFTIPERTPA